MNIQSIAEKDQTGAWTDYVFAGGKRIAMVQSAKPVIHMHGMRDSTNDVRCGTIWYIDGQSDALNGYQIQTGDRLSYDLKQSTLNVLTALGFNNGTVAIGRGPVDGQWHHVTMDLSGSVGQVIGVVLMGPGDAYQGQGTWDAYEQNVVLTGADGSVHPLFTGGSASGYNPDGCGSHNLVFEVTKTPVDALNGTTFYVGDHLGSAQMEFSASGAPLSSSQFLPFGGEINPAVTANHYKFTGKERDAESGLDYFGARYYASSMGRFMSPDFSDGDPVPFADYTNPQSLNLYGYTRNNPLSNVDEDGHDCIYSNGDGTGSLYRGNCIEDRSGGVFIDGTVDVKSFQYNPENNSTQFSFTRASGNSGNGVLQGPKPDSNPEQNALQRDFFFAHIGGSPSPGPSPGIGVQQLPYARDLSRSLPGSASRVEAGAEAAKKIPDSMANNVARMGGYRDAHDLKKQLVGSLGGQYDMYKQPNGQIELFKKGGLGEGVETGINVNDHKPW